MRFLFFLIFVCVPRRRVETSINKGRWLRWVSLCDFLPLLDVVVLCVASALTLIFSVSHVFDVPWTIYAGYWPYSHYLASSFRSSFLTGGGEKGHTVLMFS